MDCRRAKEVERGCGQQTAMNANREELLFQLALMKPAGERAEFLDLARDRGRRQRKDVCRIDHRQHR